jgi:membrane protein implicated in regulation of membrane protease activity
MDSKPKGMKQWALFIAISVLALGIEWLLDDMLQTVWRPIGRWHARVFPWWVTPALSLPVGVLMLVVVWRWERSRDVTRRAVKANNRVRLDRN